MNLLPVSTISIYLKSQLNLLILGQLKFILFSNCLWGVDKTLYSQQM